MKNASSTKRKIIAGLLIGALAIFSIVTTVSAAEFPKGGSIPTGETIEDDVFLAAEQVVMAGAVDGILFASGQTITISGTISGDAILAGETVLIETSASIDGNLFIAAANVIMNGQVNGSLFGGSATMEIGDQAIIAGNLYYGGFSLSTSGLSRVGKDAFAGVYQGLLDGSIARDLNIAAAAVELDGNVGRNAKINVGDEKNAASGTDWMAFSPSRRYFPDPIQPGIRISEKAKIGGKLTYISSNDQTARFNTIASEGVIYQTPSPDSESWRSGSQIEMNRMRNLKTSWGLAASMWNAISGLITLLILGALVLWVARKPFEKIIETGVKQPGMAFVFGFLMLAAGFLALVMIPIVFILSGIILGFLSLGGLLFFWFGVVGAGLMFTGSVFLFIVFTLSKLIAAYVLGKWI